MRVCVAAASISSSRPILALRGIGKCERGKQAQRGKQRPASRCTNDAETGGAKGERRPLPPLLALWPLGPDHARRCISLRLLLSAPACLSSPSPLGSLAVGGETRPKGHLLGWLRAASLADSLLPRVTQLLRTTSRHAELPASHMGRQKPRSCGSSLVMELDQQRQRQQSERWTGSIVFCQTHNLFIPRFKPWSRPS